MRSIQFALRISIFTLCSILILAACSGSEGKPLVIQVFVTATPQESRDASATPAPTGTPAPTNTPSPTPTATPSAIPIVFRGDPLSAGLQDPTPEAGAYCGIVDTLDFPLEPPDAVNVRGGQDFGVYRERYGKNHAGEDWGIRGDSLGKPVYAIGHGVVTYADGLGWGLDKGVIIIRHTFADGSTILSFYGHLDPPSLLVVPGSCVERGQHIADIGDPVTRPHLHFEIRHHMPHVPGPGYWPEDPRTVGWEPPSAYIWNYRASRSPQVLWARDDLEQMDPVGYVDEETFIAWERGRLVGLYTPAGGLRWTQDVDLSLRDVLLSPERDRIYTVTAAGLVAAFRLPSADEVRSQGEYLVPLWDALYEEGSQPELAPLPGGGVVIMTEDRQLGLSGSGEELWVLEVPGRPDDWQLDGDALLVSFGGEDGEIWALGAAGGERVTAGLSGRLAANGDWIYVLGDQALLRYDRAAASLETLAIFPPASRDGDLALQPDGGLLVFHGDIYDRRLLSFNAQGRLLWDRSVKHLGSPDMQLVRGRAGVYLMAQESRTYDARVRLFAVDPAEPVLELVFEGGTRRPSPRQTWAAGAGSGVLLQVGGGSMVMLER